MAIKLIEVLNILAFQHQEKKGDIDSKDGLTGKTAFKLQFCDGINVLIGENGVGKSTILKMIYAAAQQSSAPAVQESVCGLQQFFSNHLKKSDFIKNIKEKNGNCYYKVSDGANDFENNLSNHSIICHNRWGELNIQSVFIPTTEMLSHTKGFLAMNQKYNMPFDKTQIDIIVNASLPETREISPLVSKILDKISAVIDGTVLMEDDSFYVIKTDGRKIDFSLEAEGLRKLGLLWKLLRNGLLEENTILLWDEPEANLNPELYPFVAEILLELQRNKVQVFAATHSYNFAKYLEIRRTDREQVMFHNLFSGSGNDKAIYSQSAYRMEDIEKNHIMIADNQLLDEVYQL